LALPLTGAASICTPRASSAARNSAEPSSEIDEHSMTIFGAALPESRPPGPSTTALTSSQADTITNTMSHAARSVSCAAILAPRSTSGSAFARVRFHTVRSAPLCARRSAIAKPMRPIPIHPSFIANPSF